MQTVIMEEGESGEDLDGSGGGHAVCTWRRSVRHRRAPNGGQGVSRRGVEADMKEERARGVDPVAVGEAVGVALRRMQRRSGCVAWT
jgi:hypothetical protein